MSQNLRSSPSRTLERLGIGLGQLATRYPKLAASTNLGLILVAVASFLAYTVSSRPEQVELGETVFSALSEDDFTGSGCNPRCQALIKASRAEVSAIEDNEVRYVLAQIQGEYASSYWQKNLKTCVANWDWFQKAQRYTMYPAAFLAGKAYVESAGCKFARSGDGGYGPMQITTPEARHIKDVATMLHLKSSQIKWKEDYWHNVLVGAVMLSDYENAFESRGVGIFAYNSGPGATRRYMRKAGIDDFTGRSISDFRGTIPEGFNDGSRPRRYLDRILAGAVLVQRAYEGKPTTGITKLSLNDIPGASPANDAIE